MLTAILAAGVVLLMLAGHIAWRVSRGWRTLADIAMAVALCWAGVQMVSLHTRLTVGAEADAPPAISKKWERAI